MIDTTHKKNNPLCMCGKCTQKWQKILDKVMTVPTAYAIEQEKKKRLPGNKEE